MKKIALRALGVIAVSTMLLAGCVTSEPHIPEDTLSSSPAASQETYEVQAEDSNSLIEFSSTYEDFVGEPTGDREGGLVFAYNDGEEIEGNLIKVRALGLEDYDTFDDFIDSAAESLLGEDPDGSYLAEGVVKQNDTQGYGWVYKNSQVDYLGHVVRVFPIGQGALLFFGTAEGDLNRLERIIETFDFEEEILE